MMISVAFTMEVLFWVSAGIVLYTYFGYPLLLAVLASLKQVWMDLGFAFGRRDRRQGPHLLIPFQTPPISGHGVSP